MGTLRSLATALALCGAVAASSVTAASPPPTSEPTTAVDAGAPGCDPIDERLCLLPFPNDHFTVADPSTPTGRRVALPADGAPVNVNGVPIDLTEWNATTASAPTRRS